MIYENERREICQIARIMFDRKLTNIAGGNISMKAEDNLILITPSLMSEEKYCRINPEEILVVDMDMNLIEGQGKITRECNMHLGIYNNLPLAKAVIHAHPKETLVFSCLGIPLEPLYEGAEKFGTITPLEYAPSCSTELANVVISHMSPRNDELKKKGIVALLRRHGVVIADRTLKKAFDTLERIETNAYVNIQTRMLMSREEEKTTQMPLCK